MIMGYVMCAAACFGCKQPFYFNPNKVPAIRVEGEKMPVCRDCIERANRARIAIGIAPFEIDPHAYEPLDEGELG
jgi:hypothetical protein